MLVEALKSFNCEVKQMKSLSFAGAAHPLQSPWKCIKFPTARRLKQTRKHFMSIFIYFKIFISNSSIAQRGFLQFERCLPFRFQCLSTWNVFMSHFDTKKLCNVNKKFIQLSILIYVDAARFSPHTRIPAERFLFYVIATRAVKSRIRFFSGISFISNEYLCSSMSFGKRLLGAV